MTNANNTKPGVSRESGYRKPPKSGRFRKGRSGNPHGRPRGDENLMTVFKRLVSRRVRVRRGDRIEVVTLAEAVLLKNYEEALHKSPAAMANILRIAEEAGEFAPPRDPKLPTYGLLYPIRSKDE